MSGFCAESEPFQRSCSQLLQKFIEVGAELVFVFDVAVAGSIGHYFGFLEGDKSLAPEDGLSLTYHYLPLVAKLAKIAL